jgi:hypothetical protein
MLVLTRAPYEEGCEGGLPRRSRKAKAGLILYEAGPSAKLRHDELRAAMG